MFRLDNCIHRLKHSAYQYLLYLLIMFEHSSFCRKRCCYVNSYFFRIMVYSSMLTTNICTLANFVKKYNKKTGCSLRGLIRLKQKKTGTIPYNTNYFSHAWVTLAPMFPIVIRYFQMLCYDNNGTKKILHFKLRVRVKC